MSARVVVVDHKDSFAFILGEQFAALGAEVDTVRSDVDPAALGAWIDARRPALVVLSPGPGGPEDCGATLAWLRADPAVPVLGVCLGMQAMAAAAGGVVGRALRPVHGRASRVHWIATAAETSNPLATAAAAHLGDDRPVGRYHSLAVLDPGPDHIVVAETRDRVDPLPDGSLADGGPDRGAVAMAMVHRRRPRLGLQFHPESVLTPSGARLLGAVLSAAQNPVGQEA